MYFLKTLAMLVELRSDGLTAYFQKVYFLVADAVSTLLAQLPPFGRTKAVA
ncbi:MAG: hypothetical protein R3Y62_01325 [Eubacteriales bacterium]